MSDETFQELMTRLRTGDGDAATEIFSRFAHRLIGLARKRLSGAIKSKVDPEDIVQSVFRSFFRAEAEGRFELSNWDDLWNLLAVITLRKCGHRVEHFLAARRDVTREAVPLKLDDDSAASWEHIAREPTPFEATVLIETLEVFLSALPVRQRSIVELTLQGMQAPEISEQLGCSERTVERTLTWLRKNLEKESKGTSESEGGTS